MIANNIKELRRRSGLNQTEFAKKIGVTQGAISLWEGGRTRPNAEQLKAISDVFGVSIESIISDKRPSPPARPRHAAAPIRVPVLGSIPAGIPMEAIEDIIDYEEVPADWGRGGQEYFALKIRGNSMKPVYLNGDVLIFCRQDTCDSGQDCAVMVNGDDATFKRVRRTSDGITLQPLNPDFEPRHYSNKEIEELPVRVLGVVVEIRRKIG